MNKLTMRKVGEHKGRLATGSVYSVELNEWDTGFVITEWNDNDITPVGILHNSQWSTEPKQGFPRFNAVDQALEHIAHLLGVN